MKHFKPQFWNIRRALSVNVKFTVPLFNTPPLFIEHFLSTCNNSTAAISGCSRRTNELVELFHNCCQTPPFLDTHTIYFYLSLSLAPLSPFYIIAHNISFHFKVQERCTFTLFLSLSLSRETWFVAKLHRQNVPRR